MLKISNSKLILGTVQMGLPYGINNTTGKVSLDDSFEILEYAFENGIEILDSAEAYGNAHEVIGAFHKKYPAKKFQIITKLPNQLDEDIVRKVGSYLDELEVDQLHALLFHSFSSYKNNINNLDGLRKLKSDGEIKNIGVSVYTNVEMEEVLENEEIDIIQLPFNLFDNTNLRGGILEKARSMGKTIHTRSTLLQGLFFKNADEQSETVQNLKNELTVLSDISKKHNVPISKLALSYCIHQNTINNVLVGVDSISQLKDNIQSVNYEISPEIIDEINVIHVTNLDVLNPSLWS